MRCRQLYRSVVIVLVGITIAPGAITSQALDASLATVRLHKTSTISRNEHRNRVELVEAQTGRSLSDEQKLQLLDAMIDAELMLQDAMNVDIRVREQEIDASLEQQRTLLSRQSGQPISEGQFKELIEQQTGLQWNIYRQQVKERLLQESYVLRAKRELFAAIKEPTDSAVRTFYEQNATQFTNPAIVHVEFLLLRTDNVSQAEASARNARATEILRTIGGSSSEFESQKQGSLDDPSFSANEIILLRENRQQLDIYGAAFMRQVFELEERKIAPTVVESKLGYHIIRVIDKREPKILLLSDPILPGQTVTVQSQIRNQLLVQKQQEVLQKAVREVIADLRNRADIKTFPDRL